MEQKKNLGRLVFFLALSLLGVALLSLTASAYVYETYEDQYNIENGDNGMRSIAALPFDNPNFNYVKLINADTTTVHRNVGYNPDKTMIVTYKQYNDVSGTKYEIFLYDANGDGETMISFGDSQTGDIHSYAAPMWADDGETVGFVEQHFTSPNKVVAYDTAGTLVTTDDTWTYIYEPTTSDVANFDFLGTSTSEIVFWTYGFSSNTEKRADLFIWDGTMLTNITNSDFREYEPVSNPAGDKILYWSGEEYDPSDPGYDPYRTTHLLTYNAGTDSWDVDVGFTAINDTYWGTFTSDADKIALSTGANDLSDGAGDLFIYNPDGTFDFDLTGPSFPGTGTQWNFFGTYPDGPMGSWIFGSNQDGPGRDVYLAYPSSCADIVYVDDDWIGSTAGDIIDGHIFGYDAFSTIQNGVDSVCECGTVYVNLGTYVEQVTIRDKSLKLIGDDATIQMPSSGVLDITLAESSASYQYLVGIWGYDQYNGGNDTIWGSSTITVEMSGFTLDANDFLPADRYCSILMRNVNTDHCDNIANIHDNELINIDIAGDKQTFGMLGYGTMDITIQDNVIDQFQRGGIGIYSGYAEVIGNTVIGPDIDTVWAPNGIQLGYGASGLIEDNDVMLSDWPGTDWAGSGILVVDTSDVIVNENYVHNCEQAIGVVDFPECQWGSDWEGIVSDIEVTSNLIEDNEWGIAIANDVDGVLVEGNLIYDTLGDGIDVYNYDPCVSNSPRNIVIICNEIVGSGYDGLWVGPSVTDTVDAECNWWGDISGPFNDTWNPSGLGDSVVGNADADPWIGQVTADAGGPYHEEYGSKVTFDGSGSFAPCICDPIVSYEWTFGDGSTGSGKNPSHLYTDIGTYQVTLTVTTVYGATDTVTTTVVIGDSGFPPVVQILNPEEGDMVSGTVNIEWFAVSDDSSGSGLQMYLYYTTIDGGSLHKIAGPIENTGEYSWNVNSISDGEYLLIVEAVGGGIGHDSVHVRIGGGGTGMRVDVDVFDATIESGQYVKNGDTVEISAAITGSGASILKREEITADLSGFGFGTVVAQSFDGFEAVWNLPNVECFPSDGTISISVDAAGKASDTVTIVSDNTNPEVVLEKPLNGLYFYNGRLVPLKDKTIIIGPIEIELDITDRSGVDHVCFFIDDELVKTIDNAPFEWYMNQKLTGRHSLDIEVYDKAGNIEIISQIITIYNFIGN